MVTMKNGAKGEIVFAQPENGVYEHALGAESSGLGNHSSRCLGLIFGLSAFLSSFYTRDTRRQSHAELIAKATDPSLAVLISSDVSVEIFGCPATSKYLPCIRKWLAYVSVDCVVPDTTLVHLSPQKDSH